MPCRCTYCAAAHAVLARLTCPAGADPGSIDPEAACLVALCKCALPISVGMCVCALQIRGDGRARHDACTEQRRLCSRL